MVKKSILNAGEELIYLLLWAVLLATPVAYYWVDDYYDEQQIYFAWIKILPFLILFIIHNYLISAVLIKRRNLWLYIGSVIFIISAINIIANWIDLLSLILPDHTPSRDPDHNMMSDMRHPRPRPGSGSDKIPKGLSPKNHEPKFMQYINQFALSILVVGFNVSVKLASRWLKDEQKREKLEKEKLASQLAFLRNQISPHFFMNTLNNIHALIDYSRSDAKDAVIRLSKMMRFLLYESETGTTSLRKEIEFITDYFELMKLRVSDEVDISVDIPDQIPDFVVYPLIYITFIENAFRHGISTRMKSFIHLEISFSDKDIIFELKNTNHSKTGLDKKYSGIGLENTKKRLELLYGDSYNLEIQDDDEVFSVKLKIIGNANSVYSN